MKKSFTHFSIQIFKKFVRFPYRASIWFSLSIWLAGNLLVNAQTFQWAKKAGGTGGDEGFNIIADADGNSYIVGYYQRTANFDTWSVTSAGLNDIFLAKYDTDGNVEWVVSAGGTGSDAGMGVAIDGMGNTYLTGGFSETASFGTFTLTSNGGSDVFIAKCSPAGQWLWAKRGGGVNADGGIAVSTDQMGNSFITGNFRSSTIFENFSLNSFGIDDIFLVKYDNNGNLLWAQNAGGPSRDYGTGVSIDHNGDVFITGSFSDYGIYPSYFGTNTLYGGGMFIAKFDGETGTGFWAVKGGGSGSDVKTDPMGNAYVLGVFNGTANFSGTSITSEGPDDYFFARYNPAGGLDWIQRLGGTGYFKGNGLSVGNNNDLFVTGTFSGYDPTTIGTFVLAPNTQGYDEIFIAKFDYAGNALWVNRSLGSYYMAAFGVGDYSGSAYGTGFFFQTAVFGSTTLQATPQLPTDPYGNEDVFVTKINDFLHTGIIAGSTICAGTQVEVPYSLTGASFSTGNVLTAEFSNSSGSFASPVNIGTLNSTDANGVIPAIIPAATSAGNAYRIRVIASLPRTIGADNGTNIIVKAAPIANAGADKTICPGNSTTLTGSATGGSTPYTYLWNTGATASSISVSPAITTTYTLTVTGANGCSSTDEAIVNAIPTFSATISASGPTTFCQGGSVTLSASAGNSFLWSTGEITQDITVTTSGSYFVTVTDANGCSAVSTATEVTVNPLPVADAGPPDQTIFAGQSVQIGSAPVAGNTYSWTPTDGLSDANISDPIASPTSTTTYSFTVIDANGCSASDEVIITVIPPGGSCANAISLTPYSTCNPTDFTMNGTEMWFSFVADMADAKITVNNNGSSGKVNQLTVYENSCSNLNSISDHVFTNAQNNISLFVTGLVVGNSYLLKAKKIGIGEAFYGICVESTEPLCNTYICLNGDPCDVGGSTGDCCQAGCNTNAPFCICPGECVDLTITNTCGVNFNDIVWNTPGASSSGYVNGTCYGDPTGEIFFQVCYNTPATYPVTFSINGIPNESGPFYICVEPPTSPTPPEPITVTPNPLCLINNDAACSGYVTFNYPVCPDGFSGFCNGSGCVNPGGDGEWADPGGGGVNPYTWIYFNSGTYTATLDCYYSGVCPTVELSNSVSVTVEETSLSISAIPNPVCVNIPVSFTIDGCINPNSTYFWNFGDGFTSTDLNPSHSYSFSGTYQVGFTVNGCITVSTTVVINPAPEINIPNVALICNYQSTIVTANFSVGSNFSYSWSPSTGVSPSTGITSGGNVSFTFSPGINTPYTLTVTNDYGCTQTKTVVVKVSQGLTANVPANIIQCSGNIVLGGNPTASGGISPYTYSWSVTPAGGLLSNAGFSNPTFTVTSTPQIFTATVTVTDANGCSTTGQTVINTIPPVVIIDPSPVYICKGQSATLTASGAISYTWSNFQTTPTITVSPTSTTTYTVTGFGTNLSCHATTSVTVFVEEPIVPGFTFDEFDNCEEQSVTFTANANSGTFVWNFGDGTELTTSTNPITHTYLIPGYFKVTLMTSNACGTDISDQIIYIVPSIGAYNPGCCMKDFTYTFPSLDNIEVVSSGTVNVSFNIKGTLTIKSGVTLTINSGVIVGFGPQGKVIVEQGATLILDGATFTSICFNTCSPPIRMMWQGVEVWGVSSSASSTPQGKIILKNGATIEDAHIAVTLGKWELIPSSDGYDNDPNGNVFQYNGHNAFNGGGLLQAMNSLTNTNANFNRNAISVMIWEYNYYNYSKIIKSTFTCKERNCDGTLGNNSLLLDPYYNYANASDNYRVPGIWEHNPFYTGAWNLAGNGQSKESIFLVSNRGVIIKNNLFDYVEHAIWSAGASFNPNGNYINNVIFGMYFSNTFNNIGNNIIYNTFSNFSKGIIINAGKYERISKNSFNGNTTPTFSAQEGIILDNTTNYTITDNNFNSLNIGISTENSGNTTANLIGYQTQGNIFTASNKSIVATQNNFGLQIRCNQFNDPNLVWFTSPHWSIQGSLALPDQGSYTTNNRKKPAGNIFTPSRKYIFGNTNPPFKYYHHSDNNMKPVAAINPFGPSNFTTYQDNVSFLNAAASCAPVITIGSGTTGVIKDVINQYSGIIVNLESEYSNVQSILDKGQTSQLLSATGSNMTAGNLKDLLLGSSPLSDTVLIAVIERTNPLPPGMFKEVIIPNSPISYEVKPHLDAKLSSLPSGISKQIADAQFATTGYRTLTAITREIKEAQTERHLLLNDLIGFYADSAYTDSIKLVLLNETNIEAKQALLGLYLSDSNLTEASALLSSMPMNTAEDIAYFALYSMYIDQATAGKTLWEMDSAQIQIVRDIAAMCPTSLAVINAQAVLRLVFGEETSACPDIVARMASNNSNNEYNEERISMVAVNQFEWNIFPNPNDGSMSLFYNINQAEKAVLNIYDVKGKLVFKQILLPENNMLEISNSNFESGIYYYNIIINDETTVNKKLVIIK